MSNEIVPSVYSGEVITPIELPAVIKRGWQRRTRVGDLLVSSVQLVFMGRSDSPYETMVFAINPDGTTNFFDLYCRRCETQSECEGEHERAIQLCMAGAIAPDEDDIEGD